MQPLRPAPSAAEPVDRPETVEAAAAALVAAWRRGEPVRIGDTPAARPDGPGPPSLSLRGLRALTIDAANTAAVAEAGVTIGAVRVAAAAAGLWCPALRWLDDRVLVGEAVASAGATRSRGYGSVADYLLGLRFACPAVGLVRHGGLSIKNATGYNLTAAVAGSAGRLGVVLSAVFRLVPRPPQRAVDWFGFERPTRLWSAARAGGEVGALPGEQPIDAPAVIASLTLPPGRPLLVVELDDATADGLARRRALVQERLARLGGRAHNPSSGDRGGLTGGTGSGWVRQVAAVAPTDLDAIAAALTAAATRTSLTGHLLLEATGGTLELAVEPSVADRLGPLLREAGVPVRTPAVAAFAQRLAAAFDPDGLLRPYPDPAEDAHRGGNV